MKKGHYIAACLLAMLPAGLLRAQQRPGDYAGGFRKQANEVSFRTTQATVRIDFCTPALFRVRLSWSGRFAPEEHWMVTRYQWAPVPLRIDSAAGTIRLATDSLSIVLHRAPFSIDVYDGRGKLLSSESNTGLAAGGASRNGDTTGCRKWLQPGEHFFGFGERMDFLDRRGKRLVLNVGRGEAHDNMMGAYNTLEANYCPVPFFMSTRGYAIFFHNRYPTTWDMGESDPDSYSFSASGGELDYYFLYGPRFPELLMRYASVTGASPLLARYAMGLHLGTYSGGTWGHEDLASPAYVVRLVERFREMGIPLDILFLDSTWRLFAAGGHGATTFEWRDAFADPKRMFDSLYRLHLHAVGLHIRSRLDNGPRYHLLDSAQAAGITYPEEGKPGEFPNYFDSTAVRWWWDHAVMKVASQGARFLKTDEGSAFGRKANESAKTGPTDARALSLHNIFPLAYTRAAYEGFQRFTGERGLNQTREGYAGIQRYPYIFAGDWPSQWQFFAPVIRAGLNIGMSGVGYWAHCMGGFEQPADPELYIRWCQFGMLSPVAMVFGMDHPGYKEPWNYGPEGLRNFEKYDSLRYHLLPYLYSAAYELYRSGIPIMRALVLADQDDPNVYDIGDQYMLGDDLMVCPVTEKGARTRVVYLPEGTWYDYWTGAQYAGKRYLTVSCPLDQIPLFVRAGAMIPTQPVMQYVGEKPVDTITWDVYPGATDSSILYTDDGKSLDYQKGDYALAGLRGRLEGNTFRIRSLPLQGRFDVSGLHYRLQIHLPSAPRKVSERNHPLSPSAPGTPGGWHYDAARQVLEVLVPGKAVTETDIRILLR